ncbi:prolactin-8A8-like [Arvicanthis niloticus]|uniref:prolactin-8A8-like n=1 Tax=Arvicanthis niloticus TaxID=61156 RepID=UPI00148739EA|nr:prolactin-8A8-like [Arvicanthis niloticus]
MVLPSSLPHFWALLLVVVSNLLLWEKATSIPACETKEGGCWDPLEETLKSAIQRAKTNRKLANEFYVELYHNKFSAGQFADLRSKLMMKEEVAFRAGTYCHSSLVKLPRLDKDSIVVDMEWYLTTMINFVGSWVSPLYQLVIELSAMENVHETTLSKAKEIEENNREILDDLRWIFTQVYPTAEKKEEFPNWGYLSSLKSSSRSYKFLAMFNIFRCLRHDAQDILFHLQMVECRMIPDNCFPRNIP